METHPLDPWTEALEHLKRANTLRNQNENESALLECNQAIHLAPDWADAHYLRGFLLESLGRSDEAKEAFRQATLLDPKHPGRESKPAEQTGGQWPWVRWNNRDAWWGLVMGMGLTIIVPLLIALVLMPFSDSEDIDPTYLSILLPVGSLLWIAPAWFFAVRKYKAGWSDLGFRGFKISALGIGCAMLVGCYFVMAAYSAIIANLFDSQPQPDMAPIAEQLSIPWMLPLTAVLIAPLAEEIFFRGFLFTGLRRRYGWLMAALISSAIFALMHLEPYAIPPLFLLGFLFAYLYHRSNSIWIPIAMHFIVNSIAMIGEFIINND
ncbi:MAG: CPBP family glutamic-type intramembrane protease [Dehalococcoidia bacterium]